MEWTAAHPKGSDDRKLRGLSHETNLAIPTQTSHLARSGYNTLDRTEPTEAPQQYENYMDTAIPISEVETATKTQAQVGK